MNNIFGALGYHYDGYTATQFRENLYSNELGQYLNYSIMRNGTVSWIATLKIGHVKALGFNFGEPTHMQSAFVGNFWCIPEDFIDLTKEEIFDYDFKRKYSYFSDESCKYRKPTFDYVFNRIKNFHGIFALVLSVPRDNRLFIINRHIPIYYWSPDGNKFLFATSEFAFNKIIPDYQRPVLMQNESMISLPDQRKISLVEEPKERMLILLSGGPASAISAFCVSRIFKDNCLCIHFKYNDNAEKSVEYIAKQLELNYLVLSGGFLKNKSFTSFDTLYKNYLIPNETSYFHLMLLNAVSFAIKNNFDYIVICGNSEFGISRSYLIDECIIYFNEFLSRSLPYGKRLKIISPSRKIGLQDVAKMFKIVSLDPEYLWNCELDQNDKCTRCVGCNYLFKLNKDYHFTDIKVSKTTIGVRNLGLRKKVKEKRL